MNKLQMAHDYLRDIVSNWEYDDSFNPVDEAWKLADAMQAEAEKRKPNPVLPALHQTFIDGIEQPRYAEEWQPAWSQAPEWANSLLCPKLEHLTGTPMNQKRVEMDGLVVVYVIWLIWIFITRATGATHYANDQNSV